MTMANHTFTKQSSNMTIARNPSLRNFLCAIVRLSIFYPGQEMRWQDQSASRLRLVCQPQSHSGKRQSRTYTYGLLRKRH